MIKLHQSILSFVFTMAFVFVQSQEWDVDIYYQDSVGLELKVQPNYDYNSEYAITFPKGIVDYNEPSNVLRFDSKSGESHKVNDSFTLNSSNTKFTYQLTLGDSSAMAHLAYLEYGAIRLVNLEEILFTCDKDVTLNIRFHQDEKVYDLGSKDLKLWKANPTPLVPMKALQVINQVSVFTNLPNDDLSKLIEETLVDFSYFDTPVDLVLLFGADSVNSSGTFFEDFGLVYVDAKTSGEHPNYTIQQELLKSLYRGLSPYGIYPEEALRNIEQNWLAEASPEYLSLKFMLKHDMLGAEDFLALMSEKVGEQTKYFGTSLAEMSKEVYRNSAYLDVFESKGCIASWFLDLRLFELTNGQVASEDLIFGKFGTLDDETQLLVSDALFDMEKDLVSNSEEFPMPAYLNPFGLRLNRNSGSPFQGKEDLTAKLGPQFVVDKSASNEQKMLWKRFATE